MVKERVVTLNSKSVYESFQNLIKTDKLECIQSELEEFLMYGLLFKSKTGYITRDNRQIKVNLIKTKSSDFDLDFNSIISKCEDLHKSTYNTRIYCMTKKTYDVYKSMGLILEQDNHSYYRFFDKELWLVNLI